MSPENPPMRKLTCLFPFLLFYVLTAGASYASRVPKEEALIHYRNGLELLKQDRADEAVEEFKRAVHIDRGLSDAYCELAKIHMKQGRGLRMLRATHYNRMARREIERAIKIQPDNPTYHLVYGMILRQQGFGYYAEREFKEAIRLDPSCAEAYCQLGHMKEEEMLWFKDMIYSEGPDKVITIYRKYAEEDFEKLTDYYTEALELDPDRADIWARLALDFYEYGHVDKLVEFSRRAVEADSSFKDGYLLLGLGYNELGEHGKAYEAFMKAEALMDPEERAIFESPELLLPPGKELEQDVETFWRSRDPLFLTDYNER